MIGGRVGVLIVDDSAVVRQVLTELLGEDPGIEVHRAAADPDLRDAADEQRWPDVVVLDIEMPRMDGITFLRRSWPSGRRRSSSARR